MPPAFIIRPIGENDSPGWKPLWEGYNAFYGRTGETTLPDRVTEAAWQRFF